MGKIAKAFSFDYSLVDADTKGKLIALAGQVKRGKANYAKSVIEIGAAVHEAHELLAGDGRDGKFANWCEDECGIERRTAYNYLWAFDRFGKCETVSHFSAGAMYALASPTTPEKAVKEALKLADKGIRITKGRADDLIDKHTVETYPKTPKTPKPPSQSDAAPATEDDGEDWLNDHVREEPAKPDGWTPPDGVKQFADTFEVETPDSKDAFGSEVCDELAPAFGLCEEFDAQRAKLTGIKSWLTQRIEHPGAVVLKSAAQRLRTAIDEADAELRFSRPHCECVYCRNKPPKVHNCPACKGLGWMTKPLYDAAPKEMKRVKAQG